MPPTRSEPTLQLPDGSEVRVDVRRHPRAKRWSLRYDLKSDRVRLTMPRRGSALAALAWAMGKGEWVAGQRAKRARQVAIEPGAIIPFRGRDRLLVHDPMRRRGVTVEEDRLVVGGPLDGFAGRVTRWVRAEARRMLGEDSEEIARAAGVTIEKVGIGDARTRWGSCSASGSLRYSWRLVLMPDEVRRYVVAHEIAHRRHMDHGREFHALEARLHGDSVTEARRLLRVWGERVRLVG